MMGMWCKNADLMMMVQHVKLKHLDVEILNYSKSSY